MAHSRTSVLSLRSHSSLPVRRNWPRCWKGHPQFRDMACSSAVFPHCTGTKSHPCAGVCNCYHILCVAANSPSCECCGSLALPQLCDAPPVKDSAGGELEWSLSLAISCKALETCRFFCPGDSVQEQEGDQGLDYAS
uniref:Uncharacterized protein n=1 Tax=Pyrodinium bahamense TaxID=73915 RepID=A0A7S0A0W8_9DINO|mmetsp:Transcript_17419/g.48133  ORF Transcript_17419/g.48133 Transcript_17419/m.48133 type:complete len:137 (+) Transcript_17419:113-523(+)